MMCVCCVSGVTAGSDFAFTTTFFTGLCGVQTHSNSFKVYLLRSRDHLDWVDRFDTLGVFHVLDVFGILR
jgi:hypothetical protein